MAAITLRIRQILPSFWGDEDIAKLSLPHRLLYIGLWCVADDAGYMPWKPSEIAWALRCFTAEQVREGVKAISKLPGVKRFYVERCRRHAVVPNMTEYQRYAKSTHNVTRHQREHQRECLRLDVQGPGTKPTKARVRPASGPLGTERNGASDARARERGEMKSIRELLPPPPGYPVSEKKH